MIEEFADLQCPPCATLSGTLKKMLADSPNQLAVIFRHFPLLTHEHARAAAYAAEAAGRQGKFWEMHDLLYQNQKDWSKAADSRPLFTRYAASLQLDLARFQTDLDNGEVQARVAADQERAKSLGVTNTPTLFLNNREVPPKSFSPEGLRAVIEEALRGGAPGGEKAP